MWRISPLEYKCGVRSGHEFKFDSTSRFKLFRDFVREFVFRCERCGYGYRVIEGGLNSFEKALVRNDPCLKDNKKGKRTK